MKKILTLLLFWVFATGLAQAQTKEEKAVAAAVEHLRQAMIAGDRKQLENITSKTLTYGHSNGNIENKTAFVEAMVNGTDYVTIALTEQTITVTGKTAVVRHNLNAALKNKNGTPGSLNVGVLMVWHKQKGQWQLLARQGFKRP